MKIHWRDLLIGVLVAYVVTDVVLSFMIKGRHPGLIKGLMQSMDDQNVCVAVVCGVTAGLVAYYAALKAHEMFSMRKSDDETVSS